MTVALITNTELTASIDERWDMDVLEALYANASVVARVANKSAIAKGHGDIINVTIDATLSVQTVGASGTFDISTVTPGTVAVTIDQWKAVTLGTTNRAEAQSFWDIKSTFPKSAGKALAVDQDDAIVALHTGLTLDPVGSEADPVTFGKQAAGAALLRIGRADVEIKNLSFVLPMEAMYLGLIQETDFTDAGMTGKGSSPLLNGQVPTNILGVPLALTTRCKRVGTNVLKAMLIHKNAFAIAIQKNNDFERFSLAAGGLAGKAVKMEALYGVKTVRTDHGCVINISRG